MRGGAPMIDVLSRVFKLKCAYLAVESYSGKGVEDEQGDIVFSREMSSIAQNMGGKILLCDDLSDTGITLNKSVDWLKKYEPIKDKIEDIKTATLWKKNKTTIVAIDSKDRNTTLYPYPNKYRIYFPFFVKWKVFYANAPGVFKISVETSENSLGRCNSVNVLKIIIDRWHRHFHH